VRDLDPCHGINDVIDCASSRGYSIAIVIHSPAFVPRLFVEKQAWPIDIIVGWHDFKRPKPDHLCLQIAMQCVNVNPTESLHIGDLPTDTGASKRAGVKSIGAGWACIDPQSLIKSNPDYYFSTVKELHNFIKKLIS